MKSANYLSCGVHSFNSKCIELITDSLVSVGDAEESLRTL